MAIATRTDQARIYSILENIDDTSPPARLFTYAMTVLVGLNVAAIVLETVPELYTRYTAWFYYIELVSIAVFTIEYGVRLWAAEADPRYRRPVLGRLRYAATPMALIDLLAILPFFLALFFPIHITYTRALRFVRLFRLLKLTRYATPLQTLATVLRERRDQLIICLFIVGILLLFASSAVYLVEYPAQPEQFSSIPATMWWGVATLTTVGYGDIYPITALGRVLGGIIAILGVGMFALPAGILASGFAEQLERQGVRVKKNHTCPHCGEEFETEE